MAAPSMDAKADSSKKLTNAALTMCVVCLEPFAETGEFGPTRVGACAHYLHAVCFVEWATCTTSCGRCRAPMNPPPFVVERAVAALDGRPAPGPLADNAALEEALVAARAVMHASDVWVQLASSRASAAAARPPRSHAEYLAELGAQRNAHVNKLRVARPRPVFDLLVASDAELRAHLRAMPAGVRGVLPLGLTGMTRARLEQLYFEHAPNGPSEWERVARMRDWAVVAAEEARRALAEAEAAERVRAAAAAEAEAAELAAIDAEMASMEAPKRKRELHSHRRYDEEGGGVTVPVGEDGGLGALAVGLLDE
jgi:hypothetical protein